MGNKIKIRKQMEIFEDEKVMMEIYCFCNWLLPLYTIDLRIVPQFNYGPTYCVGISQGFDFRQMRVVSVKAVNFYPTKGQLISKQNCQAVTSPKK